MSYVAWKIFFGIRHIGVDTTGRMADTTSGNYAARNSTMTTRDAYSVCRRSARILLRGLIGGDDLYGWISRLQVDESIRDALAGEFCGYR